MKNVTITLDEKTAGWARVHAAQRDMSLSRFIGEVLRQHMSESREYEEAMRAHFALNPVSIKGEGERYLTREEAHDRTRFR